MSRASTDSRVAATPFEEDSDSDSQLDQMEAKYSIIVPAHNEEQTISDVLEVVRHITDDLIGVDGHSSDQTGVGRHRPSSLRHRYGIRLWSAFWPVRAQGFLFGSIFSDAGISVAESSGREDMGHNDVPAHLAALTAGPVRANPA